MPRPIPPSISVSSSPSSAAVVIDSFDETISTIGPQSKFENRFATRLAKRKSLYAQASIIVPRLAMRKYHLPGNNYCQDWLQYIRNNHPLLGVFCHYKLHPLRWGQRIVFLLGSISFGLIITSFVTLLYAYLRKDMNSVLICFKAASSSGGEGSSTSTTPSSDTCTFSITYGMVTLWTLGGFVHSIFDISLWFLSACCCLLPGGTCQRFSRFRKIGSYIVLVLVACMCSMAIFSVILRAKFEARKHLLLQGLTPSSANLLINDPKSFSFVMTYLIEQGLSWFVYYFIVVSLLFSGVLGCGCIPVLGGRPYEMSIEWREKELALMKQQQQQKDLTVRTTPALDKSIPELDTFEVYVDEENNHHAFVTSGDRLPEHQQQYHFVRQQSSSEIIENNAAVAGERFHPSPIPLSRRTSSLRSAC